MLASNSIRRLVPRMTLYCERYQPTAVHQIARHPVPLC
uniref:Uncharacterized protein n=1 Tax=Pseudomonas aeruginosa TaxID=287 RepID=A0A7S6C754_PSEAI|nr:hypothetical protein [Pseudomonas aeruginosa]